MGAPRNVGREQAVRELKAFVRDQALRWGTFMDALVDETDRGAVIILATAMEDILAGNIEDKKFIKLTADERARLFGPDGPLGSFSARIRVAYALGILDRDTSRMLDLVREMRNACAHAPRSISFDDEPLWNALKALFRYISDEEVEGKVPGYRRLMLTWCCTYLTLAISSGSREEAAQAVQTLLDEANENAKAALDAHRKSLEARRKRPSGGRRSTRKAKQL